MTGMEQHLRYIEREIRFMVKDQYGNPTYAKYADRVIEDACGIAHFCSTVLSSKRPLTAILRAVRGPKGDIIMRFFNAQLHDTRIEMVMVLAEVAKLRSYRNDRKARSAHDYFMKLYRKANKRMIRLITGSKSKDSFKSMYRGLRDFAKMDDFDYDDDDDDDEIDEYFDNVGDFGDIDYAQACLEAYRDGKTPPEIEIVRNTPRLDPNLKGNEEILREIATIEAKLGRHLSDAELDDLLCGDDDDDDDAPNYNIGDLKKSSDEMLDSIVNVICERIFEKLNFQQNPVAVKQAPESLEDFIERTKINDAPDKPIRANVANELPTIDALIDLRNRMNAIESTHNDSTNIVNAVAVNKVEDASESETEESGSLPPSNMLGGNYREADFIDVGDSTDDEIVYNLLGDTTDIQDTKSTTEGLVTSDEEISSHMSHQLILSDIINDCKLSSAEITDNFITRVRNYFDRIGISVNDVFVSLAPSNVSDRLLTLFTTIRISGDYEVINEMHLNTVALMFVKDIAERFGISENLIDTELNVIDSVSTFSADLAMLNTLNKNYTSQSVDNLYSALSTISAYIYRRLNKIIEVRFVNNPVSKETHLYFYSKTDEPLDAEFEEFYRVELDGEGILNEVFDAFNVDGYMIYHLAMNENDDDEFFEQVRDAVNYQVTETPLVKKYLAENENFIKTQLDFPGITMDPVSSSTDISTGRSNIIIDNIYRICTNPILEQEHRDRLEELLKINGEYSVELESILRAISLNTQVSNFLQFFEKDTEDDSGEDRDTPMTSNFGL